MGVPIHPDLRYLNLPYIMAVSLTLPHNGPGCVTVNAKGAHPAHENRPNVPFNPTRPHNAAGIRTDPPPSVPKLMGHRPEN